MKFNRHSIGFKLWTYFTLFAVVILAVLWLLQTFFLQSFYVAMQKYQIGKIAEQIEDAAARGNAESAVDALSSDNAVLIFITDADGNIRYSADEYRALYRNGDYVRPENHGVERNPYRSAEAAQDRQDGAYRRLPEHYEEFLERLGDGKTVCYTIRRADESGTLVYGKRLADGSVLYINSTLGAVGSVVSILRGQLCAVTLLALFVGLAIAMWLSKRFANPIAQLSRQSLKIAEGNFDIDFRKGFCAETDDLADTFAYTAEKLRETDTLRRELLANVSHDLRTPLTMMKGYAELIRDMDGSPQAGKDAEIIIREADRLSLLVNDILDYSKLQSGAAPLTFEPLCLSETAGAVLEQFAELCGSNGVRLAAFIEPEKYVTADRRRMEQVLYNLISNAIAHAGGDNRVEVRIAEEGERIRTEIRDHGSGIPRDELPRIWDRYFSGKKRGSNGLGLAIVKEILTAHHADFGVDSEEGKGSTFWFELRSAR